MGFEDISCMRFCQLIVNSIANVYLFGHVYSGESNYVQIDLQVDLHNLTYFSFALTWLQCDTWETLVQLIDFVGVCTNSNTFKVNHHCHFVLWVATQKYHTFLFCSSFARNALYLLPLWFQHKIMQKVEHSEMKNLALGKDWVGYTKIDISERTSFGVTYPSLNSLLLLVQRRRSHLHVGHWAN